VLGRESLDLPDSVPDVNDGRTESAEPGSPGLVRPGSPHAARSPWVFPVSDTCLGTWWTLTDSAAVTPLSVGQLAGEEGAERGAEVLGERVEVWRRGGVGVQADVHAAVVGGHRRPRGDCQRHRHRARRVVPARTATSSRKITPKEIRHSLQRTLQPGNKTLPEIRLDSGATYGVGQPIPIHFDEPIADKKAAEKALTITTTPKVAGSWHWFDDQNVHWRPRAYWKPGTKITVAANVFGVQIGPGLYGQQNVAASITIGRSKIAKANHDTHQIEVYLDGKLARTIPTSMGQGGGIITKNGNWISLSTNSGPHVVLGKQASVHMTSASFGLPKDDPSGEGYDVWLPYGRPDLRRRRICTRQCQHRRRPGLAQCLARVLERVAHERGVVLQHLRPRRCGRGDGHRPAARSAGWLRRLDIVVGELDRRPRPAVTDNAETLASYEAAAARGWLAGAASAPSRWPCPGCL
jgi:lipoprotein-anchoring transpeptidase ErfK/SrfK